MNLEVVLLPDPERFRVYAAKGGHPPPTAAGIANRCGSGFPASATITCFLDVRAFANKFMEDVHNAHGPYFFKLRIRASGKPFVEYEMPHGNMVLEDRLWIPIDMYEAFYVEVT